MERVVVGLVIEGEGHRGAEDVEIDIAGAAVVGEASASAATGVAVEVALWVGRACEDGEGVVGVCRMVDELGSLRA